VRNDAEPGVTRSTPRVGPRRLAISMASAWLLFAGSADALEVAIPLIDEPVELRLDGFASGSGLRIPFSSGVRFASIQSIVLTLTGTLECPESTCAAPAWLSVRLDGSRTGGSFGRWDFVWETPLPAPPDAELPVRPVPDRNVLFPGLFFPGTVSVGPIDGPFALDVVLPLIGFVANQGLVTIDVVVDPLSTSSLSLRSAQLSFIGTPVPEPTTGLLMLLALTGLAVARRQAAAGGNGHATAPR